MHRVAWGLSVAFLLVALSAQGQLPPSPPTFDALHPPSPNVSIHVRVPAEASPGSKLTYHILVENPTRAAAHRVLVKATLPTSARFLRAEPRPDEAAAVVQWKIGTLAGGTRRQLVLEVEPDGHADLDLCARVQFEHGECVRTRIVRPGLQIRRIGPAEAAVKAEVAYRLEVSNTGKGTARDVVVEETLPKGLTFLTCKPSARGDNPLVWNLGDVPAGQSRVIEYKALVAEAGALTIRGEARAAGGLRRETTTTLRVAEKRSFDVLMVGPEGKRRVGDTVRYRIIITNPGTTALSNVRAFLELPLVRPKKGAPFTPISFAGATGGGKLQGRVVTWELGKLSGSGRAEVTVDLNATEPGRFVNLCTVTADGGLLEQGKAITTFVPRGTP